MPQTKSAKRTLRHDRRRERIRKPVMENLKKVLVSARKNPSSKNLKIAQSVLDRASKKGIIHRRKAARIKSRLLKNKKPL